MNGVSEIGKMKISEDQYFEGTLNLKEVEFDFTFEADIKPDFSKSWVYYEISKNSTPTKKLSGVEKNYFTKKDVINY